MGWALLLFCPAIISQPKHFAQKNSSTQINLLGKVETSKTSKSFFLELLHPKNFIRKLIVGTIAKDIVQGIIFSLRSKALALQGDFYKKVKKVNENTRTLFKTKTLFSNEISERQNNCSFQTLMVDKKENMIMNTRIANVVQTTL